MRLTYLEMLGVNFRILRTNSDAINDLWVNGIKEPDKKVTSESNLLGMIWNSIEDNIGLNLKNVIDCSTQNSDCTKRRILQGTAQVYDPFGLLCPGMRKTVSLFLPFKFTRTVLKNRYYIYM